MENFNTLLYFYFLSLFLNNNIDFFVCIRQFQKSGKYNVCNATVKTKIKKVSDKNTERGRQKEEKKEKQETEDTDKKTWSRRKTHTTTTQKEREGKKEERDRKT